MIWKYSVYILISCSFFVFAGHLVFWKAFLISMQLPFSNADHIFFFFFKNRHIFANHLFCFSCAFLGFLPKLVLIYYMSRFVRFDCLNSFVFDLLNEWKPTQQPTKWKCTGLKAKSIQFFLFHFIYNSNQLKENACDYCLCNTTAHEYLLSMRLSESPLINRPI